MSMFLARSLVLVVYTLRLLPLEGEPVAALAFRAELVAAAIQATPYWLEQMILLKIARHESRYREDVGRCRVLSSDGLGARTAWQIIPLSKSDESVLCVAPLVDAVIAIERVYESRRMCWRLPVRQQLAAYTSGRCDSAVGQKLSEIRWP